MCDILKLPMNTFMIPSMTLLHVYIIFM